MRSTMPTVVFFTSFVGLFVVCTYLWVVCLRRGLRWAKVTNVTRRQIVVATVLVIVVPLAVVIGGRVFFSPATREELPYALGELTVHVMIFCAIMTAIFKTSLRQSLRVLLITLVSGVTSYLLSDFVYRPFVYEAFVGSSNSMAPTLLGRHWQGICPTCGEPSFCSPPPFEDDRPFVPEMICGNYHILPNPNVTHTVHAADHFIVAKYLKPRRWDLLVYRFPEEPSVKYVHRVVGFPNEEITIS